MQAWVGPAIVAAFISGLVSLIVVQLNFRQTRQADKLRREEKIRDFQIALRAEIRGDLNHLNSFDLDEFLDVMELRYKVEKNFSVTVPRLARHVVFEAIVPEIHILPESVIDPVVLYVRQRQTVESMIDDMRDANFRTLSSDRQLVMLRDYIRLWKVWREMAEKAEAALQKGATQ